MSKATEMAFKNAEKTSFKWRRDFVLEVTNASLLWPDFTGKISKYHKKVGEKRSFNLVLTPALLESLRQFEEFHGVKFTIHETNVYSDNDVEVKDVEQQKLYYINVKVNISEQFPINAVMFSEFNGKKGRTALNADTIGQIDTADLESVDIHVCCYTNPAYPEKCSMYLQKIYCIQSPQEAEFGGKYDMYFDDAEEEMSATDVVNVATGDMM